MKLRYLRDVKESVLVLVLLVYRGHEGGGWGKHLIHEDEDGLLRRELDPLANHVDKLAYGEICWHKVLLLVDSRNVRLLDLLADDLGFVSYSPSYSLRGNLEKTYRNTVVILLPDALRLGLALLERVLVFKPGSHFRGCWGSVV
jgi:hypothetical protein